MVSLEQLATSSLALKTPLACMVLFVFSSTSPAKEKLAREELGADNFIISKDVKQMEAAIGTLDFIIDTVSASHPLDPILNLLSTQGQLIILGGVAGKLEFTHLGLCFGGKSIGSSAIASLGEIQEMLDFYREKDIVCTIEKIQMDYINEAFKRLNKGDVHFRFVIDVENTLKPDTISGTKNEEDHTC